MEIIDEMGENVQPTSNRSTEAFSKYNMNVDEKAIQRILEKAAKDAIVERNPETLKKIFSCIDLTTLKPDDNEDSVLALVEKVNKFDERYPDLPSVASICTYPCYAGLVSNSLEVEKVRTCCVAAVFPNAQTFIEVKIAEVGLAIHDGADEIDIVQNPGCILNGDFETVSQETDEIKEVTGDKTLKVILETGALKTQENVRKAAITAMYSGADFIKTSTGKEVAGADPVSFCNICLTIKEYAGETGRKVGIKAAGGIRDVGTAVLYWTIVKNVLGKEWLDNRMFRIGASSLASAMLNEILGQENGIF